MRKIILAAAALGALGIVPASAQEASVCTFESQVEISPGVSLEPHTGTFRTPEPGTITCTGALEGTGTIEYEGVTGTVGGGENCAFDLGGAGTMRYMIGNNIDVTGTFTFARGGVAGAFNADTNAGPFVGAFEFQPAEGQDCTTTPITRATVTGQGVTVY